MHDFTRQGDKPSGTNGDTPIYVCISIIIYYIIDYIYIHIIVIYIHIIVIYIYNSYIYICIHI